MFGIAADGHPYLDFSLYCVFSQAVGVTNLSTNEAQRWAVMEKTHVIQRKGRTCILWALQRNISHPVLS